MMLHVVLLALLAVATRAFIVPLRPTALSPLKAHSSRRDLLANVALTTGALIASPSISLASGGATAGGVYLLSAKQRYNERVLTGVTAWRATKSLDKKALKAWYNNKDPNSPYNDFKGAGYLLSNAFRTSSSTPPDRLPSVKAWKAYEAAVEGLCLKGKGDYDSVEALLVTYLDSVELVVP